MSCRTSHFQGTRYSIADLQSFLRQAGWSEELIVTMSAIGMAESGGWSGALDDGRNCNPPEYSVGLWQINLLAHPQYGEAQLNEPIANAAAALDTYQAQGLRAWGPYQTGIYRQHLPAAQAAYQLGSSDPSMEPGTFYGNQPATSAETPILEQSMFGLGGNGLAVAALALLALAVAVKTLRA